MIEIRVEKNRIENILKRITNLKNSFNYLTKKTRLKKIHDDLNNLENLYDSKKINLLNQEYSMLKHEINVVDCINNNIRDIQELINLFLQEKDREIIFEITYELDKLDSELSKLEYFYMFSGKNDDSDCYMDIQSGSGGIESQDWANILMRMYLRWADSRKFKVKILEESNGGSIGVKSATIKIIGAYAYGLLRTETGVHRMVRKSPFNSSGRRHTSFSSIFVYPELKNTIDIVIDPSDLRIDVFRASGSGGQHINRTESAVRITHIPTKIVTQSQNDRSQHKNKNQALKQLKSKLYEYELKQKNLEKQMVESTKLNISWSRQIRSYILDDSRIKDLRTGIESRNVQDILNGNLDKFIEASLSIGL